MCFRLCPEFLWVLRAPATLISPDAPCARFPLSCPWCSACCLGLGLAQCPLATLCVSGAVEQALAMAWPPDRQESFSFKLKF